MNGIALVGADQPVAEPARLLDRRRKVRCDSLSAIASGGSSTAGSTGPRSRSAPATLAIILALKGSRRWPGILIAVVAATVAVAAFDLSDAQRRRGAGAAAAGPAVIRDPLDPGQRIVPVLIGGCAIAMVSFADTSVLSRSYAARTGTYVDPNQEMVGARRRQLRHRLLPGLSDQQQQFAHAGGRSGRRAHPADQCGRRAGDRACCWWWRRTCSGICRRPRWPRW